MKKIVVKNKQSLFDIAIQEYGNVEAVFWIIEDNDWIHSPVDIIEAGDELNIREQSMNFTTKEYLKNYEVVSGGKSTHPEGVGFWRVEKDFIVQ